MNREEKKQFKAESRAEEDALFADAVKNYQKSVYRNTMREFRIDMANYIHMPEKEKQQIRNAFIDHIQRIAYDETNYTNFYNSEYYADYQKKIKRLQEKEGGKKLRKQLTTRRKKRTRRRRQKRTRRHGRK